MFKKYPSLFLLILVAAGIIFADLVRPPGWLFLFLCLALAVTGLAFLNRLAINKALVFFGLSLFCFSAYHFGIRFYEFGPNHITKFVSERKHFQIFGRVADWPDLKTSRTEIKIAVDSLGSGHKTPVKGSILLKISDTTTAFQRGDRLEFYGTIYPLRGKSDPGSFDYSRYLKLQGMFGVVYLPTVLEVRVDRSRRFGLIGLVDKLRAAINDSFIRNLSPSSAALASGILIGETREIPDEIYRRFRDSGTLHLLAVSGSNVALIILFMVLLMRPFSIKRKQRAIILICGVFIFALLSYGEPSVVRASLMASLVLIATIIERRFDLNQIIATAALIILLFDPAQLFGVGFQLSFATAWGLIFITPKIVGLFKSSQNKIWFRWLVIPLLVSLVAQICSAPLIAYYFDRVPAISVAANIVIVPLVSLAVVGALILCAVDLIWPLLGLFFGSLIDGVLRLVMFFLEVFGEEGSLIISTADITGAGVLIIYAFLLLSTLALYNKPARRIAISAAVVLLNFALSFAIVSAATADEQKEYLQAFNIPGGTAVVLGNPDGVTPAMVITGIQSRDYPMDERIFETALSAMDVTNLEKIIVMSAEYGAVDDLIRLASKMKTRQVYVYEGLSRSFSDVRANMTGINQHFEIIPFGNKFPIERTTGMYLSERGVSIDFDLANVDIVRTLDTSLQKIKSNGSNHLLIIGSYNPIKPQDIDLPASSPYPQIICSRIEQRSSLLSSNSLDERVYSIESQGPCQINVPSDSAGSFEIESIH
ncbi:MAG TPA: ComEC/Rec2 family competence protein [candidate division Zixibacteria bacterium]|nr:ComEC/Rec2 family competence protein [candidate division Zixibacteria bacterium]